VRRSGARSLVLCNPNNPTGAAFTAAEIAWLLQALRDLPRIVIDESFIDFSGIESCAALASRSDNAVVVKSMGKSLGWHGIRLGYAVAGEATARELRRQLPWWNINGVAAFVLERLPEFHREYVESFGKVRRDRDRLHDRLRRLRGLTV
jgi:threonine-phosphate decarboxylase